MDISIPFTEKLINKTNAITKNELQSLFSQDNQISIIICVSKASAAEGGYIFNIEKHLDSYTLLSLEKRVLHRFDDIHILVEFINHCAGRSFSNEMWKLNQLINFYLFNEAIEPEVELQ